MKGNGEADHAPSTQDEASLRQAARGSTGSAGDRQEVDDGHFVCDLCGHVMLDLHCKLVCERCGYKRDCSDP